MYRFLQSSKLKEIWRVTGSVLDQCGLVINHVSLAKATERGKDSTLLTCLGADALEIVDGLNFGNDEERKDIDVVLEKVEVFCVSETNELYEPYQFNKRD